MTGKHSLICVALPVAVTLAVTGGSAEAQVNLSTGLDASGNVQTDASGNVPTDASGQVTLDGARDAHWTVAGATNPLAEPSAFVVGPNTPAWGFAEYSWIPNDDHSSWIAANPNDASGNGYMRFTERFDLPYNPGGWVLSGRMVIDDFGVLLLNGRPLVTLTSGPDYPNWNSWHEFGGSEFLVNGGSNELYAEITYADFYKDGFRLEGEADPVPEPSSWALMATGFFALAFASFRKGKGTGSSFDSAS